MKTLVLFAVLFIGMASLTKAQIPQIIAFQGVLSTQDSAFTGDVPLTLTLYDASGAQAWSHTYESPKVHVEKGYYAVQMDFSKDWQQGSGDFSKQYWVGANINGQDLQPHVQLTASPYTMNARKSDTATIAYTALNAIKADTAAVAFKLTQDAPIGTIVAYAGQALGLPQEQQTGWYVCDGGSIPVADYPAYATAIGSIYGTSPDGTSVYLPDLRGLFLRGVNGARTDALADPDASSRFALNGHGLAGNQIGSVQADTIKSHHHVAPGDVGFQVQPGTAQMGVWDTRGLGANDVPGTSTQNTGGSETRPKNAYVFWLIKVK